MQMYLDWHVGIKTEYFDVAYDSSVILGTVTVTNIYFSVTVNVWLHAYKFLFIFVLQQMGQWGLKALTECYEHQKSSKLAAKNVFLFQSCSV